MNVSWMLPVLFLPPESFYDSPQIGEKRTIDLIAYLSRPSSGDAKSVAGGYSPGEYKGIGAFAVRRKSLIVRMHALVVDIDEGGDVDMVAELVERYAAIVHETFSSTNDDPRCRLLLLFAEPVDASTYEAVHTIVRDRLRAAGVVPDEGAKDASRVSYAPVRRADAGYRFRLVDGAPLDARKVLAAQPPPPPRRALVVPLAARDRYARGALKKAVDAIASAVPGERHYQLSREAFSLARIDSLSPTEIETALVPAAVAAMGDRRRGEAVRTIRDAIRAKRGASR